MTVAIVKKKNCVTPLYNKESTVIMECHINSSVLLILGRNLEVAVKIVKGVYSDEKV